ncbi:poly(ADP-ribose) glycohydrolase isoform X2 [Cephus cinctus]|uniref:poly(ADP-ribose) glycohydrolase n=1 Tax=Cephus cinctus TaxID=211228 RepID=A0AAJ7RBZ4_CEPCN|nr:poly(ADP-ribose) glycohydrolase isoform X2 [Cephus cinctus]
MNGIYFLANHILGLKQDKHSDWLIQVHFSSSSLLKENYTIKMSEISLDDEVLSPDMFSDSENQMTSSFNTIELDEPLVISEEPEVTDTVHEWKGVSMDHIYKGLGPFGCHQHPPISPSAEHTVLFELPLNNRGTPKPYPKQQKDKWCQGYVRMPHSMHSLYPVNHENGSNGFRQRWEVIQEALLKSFVSTYQLEAAILSYNHKYAHRWDFSALHQFFSEVVDEESANHFFTGLLPKIVQLALQLPVLVTGAIPLLKRHTNASISLSQLQVSSLLANAFLCTFPRRNSTNPQSEYAMYPNINFNRLFGSYREDRYDRSEAVLEKLKCIFHYFRRITSQAPEGTITIQRRYIPKEECPRWEQQCHKLPPLHITSKGTIESEGTGLLQVDFANKYVGGGVLRWGCVQEEIRFVICPELMVSMLVTEALDDTEALIISGIERYSKYEGYSDDFKWTGNFVDETPRDSSGRRRTSVVAIDALSFEQACTQFNTRNIIRELNKAYVGFSSSEMHTDNLAAIATGNWGCGAFRGNPQLKVLVQLMAAAVAGRSMVYFTFGDTNLRDKVADLYWHLVEHDIDVARLFYLLSQYRETASKNYSDFYQFLYKRSKMKPITNFLIKTETESTKIDGMSQESEKSTVLLTGYTSKAKQKEEEDELMIANWLEDLDQNNVEITYSVEKKEEEIVKCVDPSNVAGKNSNENNSISSATNKDNAKSISSTNSVINDSIMKEDLSNNSLLWPSDSQSMKMQHSRPSALEILGTKQVDTVNNEVSKAQKETSPCTKLKKTIDKDNSKKNLKTSQRKISDFFPPIK